MALHISNLYLVKFCSLHITLVKICDLIRKEIMDEANAVYESLVCSWEKVSVLSSRLRKK